MNVLLINPPDNLDEFIGKGKNFVPVFEPLGILYIAAVCKGHHDVCVIDAFAEHLSLTDLKERIAGQRPRVVGMSSYISNGDVIYHLGQWIKNTYPEITVVFGNIHASVFAEPYLRSHACDIVVHGEGEMTFLRLLSELERSAPDLFAVPSISFLRDGRFISTPGTGIVHDLASLPFPDRDAVKQEHYFIPRLSNIPFSGKHGILGKHLFTSRGCPFSCSFCVVNQKKPYRCNSVENAVDEMELLVKRYGAEYIFFMDSLFTCSAERVSMVCREIRKRKLTFQWGCEGHVNGVEPRLIEEMEAAGCHDIAFGIESGVQRLLDAVRKGTRIARVEEAVRMVKRHSRIKMSGLFILGLPGETEKDTLATIQFAKRLPLDMAQFSILVPYPGSALFFEFEARGEIDTGQRGVDSFDFSVWKRYSPYLFDSKNDPIWVTPGLLPRQLKKLQKRALREFYLRPRQIAMQLGRMDLSDMLTILPTFFKTFF